MFTRCHFMSCICFWLWHYTSIREYSPTVCTASSKIIVPMWPDWFFVIKIRMPRFTCFWIVITTLTTPRRSIPPPTCTLWRLLGIITRVRYVWCLWLPRTYFFCRLYKKFGYFYFGYIYCSPGKKSNSK